MRLFALPAVIALTIAAQACSEPTQPRTVVDPGRFEQVSAGGGHACAVDTLSRAWCWGSNGAGAVGVSLQQCSTPINSSYPGCIIGPVPVNTTQRFTQVSAGRNHTCGLTESGAAYCWGSNEWGQLGTSASLSDCSGPPCSPAPVAVESGLQFVTIVAGHSTTCGVTTAGVGKCWGRLLGPVEGADTPPTRSTPTTIRMGGNGDSLWLSFARPQEEFACGTTPPETTTCWGENTGGRLGTATAGIQAPSPIEASVALKAVTIGDYFGCGLRADDTAVCWGGSHAALGGGQCQSAFVVVCSATPHPATGDYPFKNLSAGPFHICGVLNDRPETRCWGSDFDYAIGLGSPPFAVGIPYPVGGSHPFTSVSAGDQFACGLTSDRNVWCWGSNRAGQVGQHPLEGRLVSLFYARAPVVVAGDVSTIP